MHSHFPVSLSQPGVTRAVIGSGLYLTVLGLFALAIGSLIRHTAGAVTTVIGLVLVIFNLTGLLPYSWGAHIHAYMPTVAGQLITQDKPTSGQLLSAVAGIRRLLRLDRAAADRRRIPPPAPRRLSQAQAEAAAAGANRRRRGRAAA